MTRALALLLGIPALFTTMSAVMVMCLGPLTAVQAALEGEEDVAVFAGLFYLAFGASLILPSLVQLLAAWRVWNGTGWTLAVLAGGMTLFTGLLCCNWMGVGCGIGALILAFTDEVREELRSAEFAE